jgi:hypothetical protein
MSLDVRLIRVVDGVDNCVYESNITHNLGIMADDAGIYEGIWRPYMLMDGYDGGWDVLEEIEFERSITIQAEMLIDPIEEGLKRLVFSPSKYKKHNPENRWGSYAGLVKFVSEYLEALKEYPDAIVEVSR